MSAGETTSGIDAELALAGQITGTVTKADGGEALGSAVVAAYRADGSGGWDYVRDTTTNATSGSYVLKALPTGDYRIGFRDDSGVYAPEYFDDQLTIEAGEDVHVNAPDVTSGIDAELALGGHITGMVTDEDAVGLANMKVRVYTSVDAHHFGEDSGWALTGADGSYDIGGLAGRQLPRRVHRRDRLLRHAVLRRHRSAHCGHYGRCVHQRDDLRHRRCAHGRRAHHGDGHA